MRGKFDSPEISQVIFQDVKKIYTSVSGVGVSLSLFGTRRMVMMLEERIRLSSVGLLTFNGV